MRCLKPKLARKKFFKKSDLITPNILIPNHKVFFALVTTNLLCLIRPQNEMEPVAQVEHRERPKTTLFLTAKPISMNDYTTHVLESNKHVIDINELDDCKQNFKMKSKSDISRQKSKIIERNVPTIMIQENIDEEDDVREISNPEFNLDIVRKKREIVERNAGTMIIQENIDEEHKSREKSNPKLDCTDFIRLKSSKAERNTDTMMIFDD